MSSFSSPAFLWAYCRTAKDHDDESSSEAVGVKLPTQRHQRFPPIPVLSRASPDNYNSIANSTSLWKRFFSQSSNQLREKR
mmetsp:Transcript_51950/g.104082  ORF Transcript_51950/g.104082 Transcript_51950/m.104082 type:complete len:81 (-) Transcript_51950:180-422(-)